MPLFTQATADKGYDAITSDSMPSSTRRLIHRFRYYSPAPGMGHLRPEHVLSVALAQLDQSRGWIDDPAAAVKLTITELTGWADKLWTGRTDES